jgi:hypothetical protein
MGLVFVIFQLFVDYFAFDNSYSLYRIPEPVFQIGLLVKDDKNKNKPSVPRRYKMKRCSQKTKIIISAGMLLLIALSLFGCGYPLYDMGFRNRIASVNLQSGPAPLTVDFEGRIMLVKGSQEYQWFFGDGTTGIGQKVTHTYDKPGIYKATLIMTLQDDLQCKPSSVTITVFPAEEK